MVLVTGLPADRTAAAVPSFPTRFRRRLTLAFVLVASASTAALAVLAYLFVRGDRLDRFEQRSRNETAFDLARLEGDLRSGDLGELVARYEDRPGIDAVAVSGDAMFASSPDVSIASLPETLRREVREGQTGEETVILDGKSTFVVGRNVPASDAELYVMYSREQLLGDIRRTGWLLIGGWAVVTALAGAFGVRMARRTLAPVAAGARAAHELAEGMLDTRLPIEGRDEFSAWAAAFNTMADAVQDKVAALEAARERERRFNSDVAHELRTPLSAIVGEAELLREHLDALPDDARQAAAMLVDDVGRLRRLILDLLEISRLGGEQGDVETEPIDLVAAVQQSLAARRLDGDIEVCGDYLGIRSDRRRLDRIVGNLAENAVRHGGGRARVSVSRDNGWAIVAVRDWGPGIAAKHVGHLFEPFYKADAARSGPGTGLGLAIAAEHARVLGGTIDVRSEGGSGACFTVRLPANGDTDLDLPGAQPADEVTTL